MSKVKIKGLEKIERCESDGCRCPKCHQRVKPAGRGDSGLVPLILSSILCPIIPCCLPFLLSGLKVDRMRCPACNAEVGRGGAKKSTVKRFECGKISFSVAVEREDVGGVPTAMTDSRYTDTAELEEQMRLVREESRTKAAKEDEARLKAIEEARARLAEAEAKRAAEEAEAERRNREMRAKRATEEVRSCDSCHRDKGANRKHPAERDSRQSSNATLCRYSSDEKIRNVKPEPKGSRCDRNRCESEEKLLDRRPDPKDRARKQRRVQEEFIVRKKHDPKQPGKRCCAGKKSKEMISYKRKQDRRRLEGATSSTSMRRMPAASKVTI